MAGVGLGEAGGEVGGVFVAGGAGEDEGDAEEGAGLDERAGDVVAVADEDDLPAIERAQGLADGQEVGHRLAGVGRVGQGVDDRDRGVAGQLLDRRLRERPDGQGVDVLADHPGEVGHALADAEADVLAVEEQGVAAELGDRPLEAHPGPQRGLVEDQAQGPAGQELPGCWRAPPLAP